MRKYILFIVSLLLIPVCLYAVDGFNTVNHPAKVNGVTTPDKINTVSGLAAGGGACALLDETFEGSDGTNITSHGSWTADGTDPGDWIELDTAQHYAGSSSVLQDNATASADRYAYHSFTTQSSGSFTTKWYVKSLNPEVVERHCGGICNGTIADANCITILRFYSGDIDYRTGGTWVKLVDLTGATWYGIKVIIDMDDNPPTFDIYVDTGTGFGAAVASNVAAQADVDPNRFYVSTYQNAATENVWMDSLCIE